MGERITDQRFLHLIGQFLKAGYCENWKYHKTYSGTPQGGNLSPVLSNIYLNKLDQMMAKEIAAFWKGKARKKNRAYNSASDRRRKAKKRARITGNWKEFKALRKEMLNIPATDPQDPTFRRLTYVRYADDVRHLTRCLIPLGERRSSEEMTSGSLCPPGGESQRGN